MLGKLRRLMLMFRRPAAPIDPELVATRRRLDAAESRLARKLGKTLDQLRAEYERGDGALAGRH